MNVAARLQALAEPGGICVSAPVRAYQVRAVEPAAVPVAITAPGRRWAVAASIAVVAAALLFGGWRVLTRAQGGVAPEPIRSLAVLPLENLSGDPEQAFALHAALALRGEQGYLREVPRSARERPLAIHVQLARIHAQLGGRDEAFAELELAYAARDGDLVWIRTFPPGLDSIRDDPRFADLVRRIGIPES